MNSHPPRSPRSNSAAAPPRPDLSAYLTQQILAFIRGQGLQPGDRLPAAKALAERFSVATPTMREALRRLQATGVVDIRHGSGIFVRRGEERLMLPNPNYGGLKANAVLDLLDARLMIEPSLAERAAERADETVIAELTTLLHEAEHHLDGQDEVLQRINMTFHGAIARASGNPILAQIIESLGEIYSTEQFAILALFNARAQDHYDHLLILAAIRSHNPAQARERMHRHIQSVRAVVEARMDGRDALPSPPTPSPASQARGTIAR